MESYFEIDGMKVNRYQPFEILQQKQEKNHKLQNPQGLTITNDQDLKQILFASHYEDVAGKKMDYGILKQSSDSFTKDLLFRMHSPNNHPSIYQMTIFINQFQQFEFTPLK